MKSGVSRRNVAKSELQNLIPVIDWIFLSLYFHWMSNLHQYKKKFTLSKVFTEESTIQQSLTWTSIFYNEQ